MTRKEITFTRVIRSRGVAALISLAAIVMTVHAYAAGRVTPLDDFRTIAFPTPSDWLADPSLSLWCNIAVTACVGVMMILINRCYNILRTTSAFFAAYFMLTTAATPCVMGQLTSSSLLALVMMAAAWIMFGIYNVRISTKRVYLAFLMIGAGMLTEYTFILFVPVFIAALGQMRIFSFKKIIAAILGLITPAWIAWGLGLVMPPEELPVFVFTPPSQLLADTDSWPMLATVALTLLTGFVLGNLNLIKIIGFNAQARAYNGLLSLLSIATGTFALVNFTNITFYIILLNACVAFQVGHFFRFTVMRRGYIVMLVLMAAYLSLYVWAIVN